MFIDELEARLTEKNVRKCFENTDTNVDALVLALSKIAKLRANFVKLGECELNTELSKKLDADIKKMAVTALRLLPGFEKTKIGNETAATAIDERIPDIIFQEKLLRGTV